jgi:acetylglutamate kinase
VVRKNCFIKVSGDMLNDKVMAWIKELSKDCFVVICVGGGTQINEALRRANLPIGQFGPLGREITSFKSRQLARDVLEQNQAKVQDLLTSQGIQAVVIIPVLEIGSVLCHVNGDQYTLAAYHGFDELYVVTTNDRVDPKKEFFAPYPKIQVIAV